MAQENGSSNSSNSVLSDWIGYWVFISHMSGPNSDTEDPSKPVKSAPEARTEVFLLEGYDDHGLEVKPGLGQPTVFMSWGAVLTVQGPPPEAREEIDREVARRAEEGE
jgi:hypothetical protein